MKAAILYSTLTPDPTENYDYQEHHTKLGTIHIRSEIVECNSLVGALDMASKRPTETVLNTILAPVEEVVSQ